METLFVCLIAYAVDTLALKFALGTMVDLRTFMTQLSSPQVRAGLALILTCPAAVAVFWIAIRIAGRGFAEYLALNWPTPRELAYALAVAAIVVSIEFVIWPFNGHHPSIASSALLISLIGSCIAAPISEEIAFLVSRPGAVVCRSGRCHRADFGGLCDDTSRLSLVGSLLGVFIRSCSWLFSSAYQLNLVDGHRSFGRQYVSLSQDGLLSLAYGRNQRDCDRHRDRRQDRLQRDDLREQWGIAAHLASEHISTW
jgi:hypothetical protein